MHFAGRMIEHLLRLKEFFSVITNRLNAGGNAVAIASVRPSDGLHSNF